MPCNASDFQQQRLDMVAHQLERRGLLDKNVLAAMRKVPRHCFVPGSLQDAAYEDRPLPIGHGQTISQPYMVGLMTSLVQPDPEGAILEVGTGSGYQAAVLAELSRSVFTIEIVEILGRRAEAILTKRYNNVHVRIGDGYRGWPEEAPFDRIIVTAAAGTVPPPLVGQLASPGRMVIPVGPRGWQDLLLITKDAAGKLAERVIEKVAFVELVGAYGWHQAKDNS